jgi:molybdate transport system ATP-binding protein
VLGCTVLDHDAARGLTRLGFVGGTLVVPLRDEPPGTRLRLRLRARDVAVATRAPEGLSINNALPCTLTEIVPAGVPHEAFLRLDLGGSVILARVLQDTVLRLGLTPGMPLFALVKAVVFDHAAAPAMARGAGG